MLSKYMQARNRRIDIQQPYGRFRGGKLCPVLAVPFMQSEGGVVSQTIEIELDPIAGRVMSEMTLDVVSVFVPALAMEALKNPDVDHPGNQEIFRKAHIAGDPIFELEEENEITKRLGIEPVSINGVKMTGEEIYLAHHCAVNHLRQLKYVKAVQLTSLSPKTLTPALLSSTVLDRMNGVLDPEDRINGAVNLGGSIPVEGLKRIDLDGQAASGSVVPNYYSHTDRVHLGQPSEFLELELGVDGSSNINAVFKGDQKLSLQQFYQAERMDQLTREMRSIVDANPHLGEEIVTRMAHGLSVDAGKEPFVVYKREVVVGKSLRNAMDGASLNVSQTDSGASVSFTVPIPQTEFGGVLMTFASFKPDEVLRSQPHPVFSTVWKGRNFLKDEMAVDPVAVTIRELDGDCAQGDENTTAMYVGNNQLYRRYVNYGFNRHIDTTTVQNQNSIWQLEIPVSVTPQTVLYPLDLPHYPWVDQDADVVKYRATSQANIMTPLIYGPTPLEELQEIEDADLFEDGG